jgi:hypothetical protein
VDLVLFVLFLFLLFLAPRWTAHVAPARAAALAERAVRTGMLFLLLFVHDYYYNALNTQGKTLISSSQDLTLFVQIL